MRTGAYLVSGILMSLALVSLSACGSTNGNNCENGLSDCNGACVNFQSDGDNCGACGTVCGAGEICETGACVPACPTGQLQCGGTCVDPDDNVQYCGATGDCLGANAGQACAANYECTDGACACAAPYTECADDVCVNLDNDAANCGACYNQCADSASCIDGVCRAAVTYAGALTPTNGRWSYGGVIGLEGANAECSANWANSRVCTEDELYYAGQNNELVNAMDVGGNTVAAFWLENENRPDNQECVDSTQENIRWSYQTAHIMHYGYYAALENATGVLDVPAEGGCNTGMYNVPCCYEAVVIE